MATICKRGAVGAVPWTRGHTNQVPIKMGLIGAMGYMPDYVSNFCPSAAGMPDNVGLTSGIAQSLSKLPLLKTTGGTQWLDLIYGDYTAVGIAEGKGMNGNLNRYIPTGTGWARTVRGDYSYRGIAAAGVSQSWNWIMNIPGVKPQLRVYNGEMMFATDKILGERAILSDMFDQNHSRKTPGVGDFAHRDGYNVYYGDNHAAWYGDPQRRIAWWQGSNTSSAYMRTLYTGVLDRDDMGHIATGTPMRGRLRDSYAVFHQFDASAGIDLDHGYLDYQ